MFELKIALKYLIPRRKNLSSSILAILSAFVISLVVALVLIFFSITSSIEEKWLEKITALNAPLRLTPTKNYFDSYYYQVDGVSHKSDYAHKSLKEKLLTTNVDPFDPEIDSPLETLQLDKPETKDGKLRNLAKELTLVLDQNKVDWHVYQISGGSMRIRQVRDDPSMGRVQNFLSFYPYFFSFQKGNKYFQKMILEPDGKDLTNLLNMLFLSAFNAKQEAPSYDKIATNELIQKRLERYFSNLKIESVTSKQTSSLPIHFLPSKGTMKAIVKKRGQTYQIIMQKGSSTIEWAENTLKIDGLKVTKNQVQLMLPHGYEIEITSQPNSFHNVFDLKDLLVDTKWSWQGFNFEGKISLSNFEVTNFKQLDDGKDSIWFSQKSSLHEEPSFGYGVLLPKTYKKKGVCIGDIGYLGYQDLAATSIQEQRLTSYVAGFYDPGLSPFAGKVVVLDEELVSQIAMNSTTYDYDRASSNGFMAWFHPLQDAGKVKLQLMEDLQKANLSEYFDIETYQDYEFAKPLLGQFQSDKALFSLITVLVLIVACTNIISFLILLVHTKSKEIGILSAMGASKQSIAFIFGLCGVLISVVSVVLGSLLATWILGHMDLLLQVFSFLKTHSAFNEDMFGLSGNISLNLRALSLVAILTPLIAVLAGTIASIKALSLKPTEILRS